MSGFVPLTERKKISTAAPAEPPQTSLTKLPKTTPDPSLAANVADIEAITLTLDLALISFERAGIFNT
ncbi:MULTISPECIES: hypothetical protein [Pseudomonas]|uniref:hypothetical protein n=1 Tax=Pseudomonas TaxID=286 RepID=UPI0015EC463E|nr:MULTISPECIES: hypothetical protein [Pseudomonas]MBY9040895.1 hypothetical protein [Pseudomonas fluorescens]MBY9046438.1 hypothetical protein [Pseudomonas fluorescens]MBY9052859.1 hypothetical protein [Pseudomonas fluorescens]